MPVAFNKVFDTNSQVLPETQNVFSVRNLDGSLATAPTVSNSGGGPMSGTITVTTTPQLLRILGRRSGSSDILHLENADDSAQPVYFGPKNTVTSTGATRGHELNPGAKSDISIGNNGISIYVVTASATATLVWSVL
jgi:hypothetical protein